MALGQQVDVVVAPQGERRPWRRVSWGAILAGAAVAFVLQVWFGILGLAIGAYAFDPETTANPWRGFGVGAGIWWLITGTISLIAGGWVTGRLAGSLRKTDGAVNGVVMWGVVTIATMWMFASAAGNAMNTAMNTLQRGVSAAAVYSTNNPNAMNQAANEIQQSFDLPTTNEAAQQLNSPETRERADEISDYIGATAMWVAVTMFIGLVAAGFGGSWGAPGHNPVPSDYPDADDYPGTDTDGNARTYPTT